MLYLDIFVVVKVCCHALIKGMRFYGRIDGAQMHPEESQCMDQICATIGFLERHADNLMRQLFVICKPDLILDTSVDFLNLSSEMKSVITTQWMDEHIRLTNRLYYLCVSERFSRIYKTISSMRVSVPVVRSCGAVHSVYYSMKRVVGAICWVSSQLSLTGRLSHYHGTLYFLYRCIAREKATCSIGEYLSLFPAVSVGGNQLSCQQRIQRTILPLKLSLELYERSAVSKQRKKEFWLFRLGLVGLTGNISVLKNFLSLVDIDSVQNVFYFLFEDDNSRQSVLFNTLIRFLRIMLSYRDVDLSESCDFSLERWNSICLEVYQIIGLFDDVIRFLRVLAVDIGFYYRCALFVQDKRLPLEAKCCLCNERLRLSDNYYLLSPVCVAHSECVERKKLNKLNLKYLKTEHILFEQYFGLADGDFHAWINRSFSSLLEILAMNEGNSLELLLLKWKNSCLDSIKRWMVNFGKLGAESCDQVKEYQDLANLVGMFFENSESPIAYQIDDLLPLEYQRGIVADSLRHKRLMVALAKQLEHLICPRARLQKFLDSQRWFSKLLQQQLTDGRHDSPAAQHAYDQHFGLIPYSKS